MLLEQRAVLNMQQAVSNWAAGYCSKLDPSFLPSFVPSPSNGEQVWIFWLGRFTEHAFWLRRLLLTPTATTASTPSQLTRSSTAPAPAATTPHALPAPPDQFNFILLIKSTLKFLDTRMCSAMHESGQSMTEYSA